MRTLLITAALLLVVALGALATYSEVEAPRRDKDAIEIVEIVADGIVLAGP